MVTILLNWLFIKIFSSNIDINISNKYNLILLHI